MRSIIFNKEFGISHRRMQGTDSFVFGIMESRFCLELGIGINSLIPNSGIVLSLIKSNETSLSAGIFHPMLPIFP